MKDPFLLANSFKLPPIKPTGFLNSPDHNTTTTTTTIYCKNYLLFLKYWSPNVAMGHTPYQNFQVFVMNLQNIFQMFFFIINILFMKIWNGLFFLSVVVFDLGTPLSLDKSLLHSGIFKDCTCIFFSTCK